MAIESSDVAAPSPTSDKATSPGAGGPPRWLVAVLVLAIGVGIAMQRVSMTKSSPKPVDIKAVDIKVAQEFVFASATTGASPQFSDYSPFLYDPATDRVVVLYLADTPGNNSAWFVQISDDGGATFAPPTSLGFVARRVAISLVPGLGKDLNIVALGVHASQERCIEVHSTSDDGRSWKLLDKHVDDSLLEGTHVMEAALWGRDLFICFIVESESGQFRLMGRRIGLETGATETLELMELGTPVMPYIAPPVVSGERLHVTVSMDENDPTTFRAVAISRSGELTHKGPLDFPDGEPDFFPKLGLDAGGLPYMAMIKEHQQHTWGETTIRLVGSIVNRDGPLPDITKPGFLRQWNDVGGWTDVDESIDRPRWWHLLDASETAGLTLAASPRHAYPKQGWDIDRIDLAAGGWTNRWTIELPQQVRYEFPKIRLRADGAALIIVERTDVAANSRDLVLLITETLPGIGESNEPITNTVKRP